MTVTRAGASELCDLSWLVFASEITCWCGKALPKWNQRPPLAPMIEKEGVRMQQCARQQNEIIMMVRKRALRLIGNVTLWERWTGRPGLSNPGQLGAQPSRVRLETRKSRDVWIPEGHYSWHRVCDEDRYVWYVCGPNKLVG